MKGRSTLGPAVKRSHANPVLPEIDRWHQRQDYVVQSNRDSGCNLIAFKNPRHRDGKQRFQAPKRRKSEEDSYGRTKGNGMRRVRNGHQRHMMRRQPALEASEWSR